MKDPQGRLEDIIEAITNVERYATKGREEFESDELIQNWFVRHLQIVGEAARSLPEEVQALSPEIPWKKIVGMRHILVHEYFGIDLDIVWEVASRDLPGMKKQIEDLLGSLRSSSSDSDHECGDG